MANNRFADYNLAFPIEDIDEDEMVLREPPVDVREIDYTHSGQVINGLIEQMGVQKAKGQDRDFATIELAALLAKGDIRMTDLELANVTGLSNAGLWEMKATGRFFDGDTVAMKKFYVENGCKTYTNFSQKAKMAYGVKPPGIIPEAAIKKLYAKIRDYLIAHKTERGTDIEISLYKAFDLVRNTIDRYLPKKYYVTDKEYLKYAECCCCGKYPPPEEGFKLVAIDNWTNDKLQYPVCQDCIEEKVPPDLQKIALLYAGYALTIEKAFDGFVNAR